MASRTPSAFRLALGASLIAAALALFLMRPGVALAHHVDLSATTTCHSYTVEADYVGGEEPRYAEVRVNGVLVNTVSFPADTDVADNFYTLAGPLPANLTVEVRMYRAQPGPDALEDIDSVNVNASASCTTTSTPTATATSTDTPAPPSSTPTATATHTPVDTETPEPTPTTSTQGSVTPLPSDTPSSGSATPASPTSTSTPTGETQTPANTSTPDDGSVSSTPTLVTTVEALQPPAGPDRPGTTGSPPQETASGLPSTGDGTGGVAGIVMGVTATLLGALGLAVTSSGMRRMLD